MGSTWDEGVYVDTAHFPLAPCIRPLTPPRFHTPVPYSPDIDRHDRCPCANLWLPAHPKTNVHKAFAPSVPDTDLLLTSSVCSPRSSTLLQLHQAHMLLPCPLSPRRHLQRAAVWRPAPAPPHLPCHLLATACTPCPCSSPPGDLLLTAFTPCPPPCPSSYCKPTRHLQRAAVLQPLAPGLRRQCHLHRRHVVRHLLAGFRQHARANRQPRLQRYQCGLAEAVRRCRGVAPHHLGAGGRLRRQLPGRGGSVDCRKCERSVSGSGSHLACPLPRTVPPFQLCCPKTAVPCSSPLLIRPGYREPPNLLPCKILLDVVKVLSEQRLLSLLPPLIPCRCLLTRSRMCRSLQACRLAAAHRCSCSSPQR